MPLVDNTLLNLHNVQIMLRPDVLLFEHSLLQLKPLQWPPLGHLIRVATIAPCTSV